MIHSLIEGEPSDPYLIPLSALEFDLVCDLLSCGCRLFFQKGKQRLPVDKEQRVLIGDLVKGCAVRAPHPRGSIGLDVGSLPDGICLIDIDDPFAARAIKAYLGRGRPFIIESTPSGGLHIWGRGIGQGGYAKNGLCSAGITVEYFFGGRITILGEGRSVYQTVPLSEVGMFPQPLWPARGSSVGEVRVPIPKGARWNTLYERVRTNQSTQSETLIFQARHLCDPPLEGDKERDLLRILEKQAEAQANEVAEGEAAGDGDLELDARVGTLLANQFRDTWAYLLPDEQWYEYKDQRWESPPGWSYEMLNKIDEEMRERGASFTRAQRKRMSCQHFIKAVEERLRQLLKRFRTEEAGLPFLNGVLVLSELGPKLIPPSPSWVCTNYANIALGLCTQITTVQRSFLLTLMDGDVLKLNLLRAFLRLVFTLDTREQFSLFLWGPGATGKSTLTELLEHILGGRCETLDVSRIANRFELTLLEGKNLLLFPDVTRQPSNAAASILKRLLSNERVTVEAKGRPAMSVKPGAHSLFTANWKWPDMDRSSGGRRRFLFLHTPITVMRRNPFLIERLKEDASGIVNWALGMPADKTRIGQSVEALNELTGGGADCSGLIEWVTKRVRYCPGAEIPLGAKKVPLPGSLYEDYTMYADANGIEPYLFNQFWKPLDYVIRSQGYRDVFVRRRARGRMVQGLSLSEGEPIRKNRITKSMRYLMETSPWPGFEEDRDQWERGGCETIDTGDSVDDVDSFDASGIINWALDMPADKARIGQSVEAINELSGGGLDSSGVMEWLFAEVLYNPTSEMPLGARKVPMPGGLYESYTAYAESHGIEPASYCTFEDILEDSVRSLGYSDILTKRRAQGRVVVGVSLSQGKRFRRTQRSEMVKYLMKDEPWDGFERDKAAFEEAARACGQDDEENEDDVDNVDYVDFSQLDRKTDRKTDRKNDRKNDSEIARKNVDNVDYVDFFQLSRKTERGGPKPKGGFNALSSLIRNKVGNLTKGEERKTEGFLRKYPRLIEELSEAQEDWPEERLVEEANTLVSCNQHSKEEVERLYAALEAQAMGYLELPPKLERSTTMGGVVYPLAQRMEESLGRLRTHPNGYLEMIETLNDGAKEIIDTCYMLFRLFRRQGSTYYNRNCPVKRLFASSYMGNSSYPRVIPHTPEGSGTIACLRRDCKRVIKTLTGKRLLPESIALDEIDMVACHTGIYVGLTGSVAAPHTWEAYKTGGFWPHILARWGEDIPKRLLKTILYSGLNGASMRGGGSIRAKVKDAYGNVSNSELEGHLQRVLRHPILMELAHFQLALGRRDKIYIPSRVQPYYGKAEEELNGKRGGSRYHEGLLSSRALASHEVVLLAYMVDCISRNALGVPLSLENDGLLYLTRALSRSQVFKQLNTFLQSCSLDLLGVKIPLERKE